MSDTSLSNNSLALRRLQQLAKAGVDISLWKEKAYFWSIAEAENVVDSGLDTFQWLDLSGNDNHAGYPDSTPANPATLETTGEWSDDRPAILAQDPIHWPTDVAAGTINSFFTLLAVNYKRSTSFGSNAVFGLGLGSAGAMAISTTGSFAVFDGAYQSSDAAIAVDRETVILWNVKDDGTWEAWEDGRLVGVGTHDGDLGALNLTPTLCGYSKANGTGSTPAIRAAAWGLTELTHEECVSISAWGMSQAYGSATVPAPEILSQNVLWDINPVASNVTLSGSDITAIVDAAGNNTFSVVGTPQYTASNSLLGDKPTIDAGSGSLSVTSGVSGTSGLGWTVAIVVADYTKVGSGVTSDIDVYSSANAHRFLMTSVTTDTTLKSGVYDLGLSWNYLDADNGVEKLPTVYVFRARDTSATIQYEIWRNGEMLFSDSEAVSVFRSLSTEGNLSTFLSGISTRSVARIIGYDDVLKTADVKRLSLGLMDEYGIEAFTSANVAPPQVSGLIVLDFQDGESLTVTDGELDSLAATTIALASGETWNASTDKWEITGNGATSPGTISSGLSSSEVASYWNPLHEDGCYIGIMYRRLSTGNSETVIATMNGNNFQDGITLDINNASESATWRVANSSGTAVIANSYGLGDIGDEFVFARLWWEATGGTFNARYKLTENTGAIVGTPSSSSAFSTMRLGILGNNFTNPGELEFAGVCVLNREPTAQERTDLDRFMLSKYRKLVNYWS